MEKGRASLDSGGRDNRRGNERRRGQGCDLTTITSVTDGRRCTRRQRGKSRRGVADISGDACHRHHPGERPGESEDPGVAKANHVDQHRVRLMRSLLSFSQLCRYFGTGWLCREDRLFVERQLNLSRNVRQRRGKEGKFSGPGVRWVSFIFPMFGARPAPVVDSSEWDIPSKGRRGSGAGAPAAWVNGSRLRFQCGKFGSTG